MAEESPKAPIRLLVADLDGTLLDPDGELSPASIAAVRQCVAAGICVVIATARPPRSSRAIYRQLGLDTPSIHYNGAIVYEFATGRLLLHRPIPGPLARELTARALQVDQSAIVSLEVADRWYINRLTQPVKTETERLGFTPDYVGDLDRFFEHPVTKALISFPGADTRSAAAALEAALGGRLSFTKSDEGVLQVMNGGVSKGSAVRFLLDRFSIDPSEAAAVGDAPNDLSMLQVVGLPIAMANGYPEVRAAAKHITLTNDEDGVAVAIRRFILGSQVAK